MSKQLEIKKQVVAEIKEKFESASSVVLTDYRGLTVDQVTKLRSQFREVGVEYKVLKNTLIKRAAVDELGYEGLIEHLEGPTAVAFSVDPVAPAKIIFDFMKQNKELEVKAGVLDGNVISAEEIKALADLPSREELLAKVCGGMQAPLQGMVSVLSGTLRNFAYAVDAIRQQKEANA